MTVGGCLLHLLLSAEAMAGFSLFPSRDPLSLLAEIDGEPRGAGLRMSQWQPYGIPGVAVRDSEGGFAWRGLSFALGVQQQDWGVIEARALRLRLRGGRESLHLGLEARSCGIVGASSQRSLELLAAGGADLCLAFRHRLWESPPSPAGARDPAGLLGLRWRSGAWTLRIFRELGGMDGGGEGVGLSWKEGAFTLSAVSGGVNWQALELAYRHGRYELACRARLHAWLGVSRGLSFSVE